MNCTKAFNGDLANEKPIRLLVFPAGSVASQFATKVNRVFYHTGGSNWTVVQI